MATLSSKLIISLVDRVSGPARGVAGSLNRLRAETRNHYVALQGHATKTGQAMRGLVGSTAAAGYGMYSFLNATKDFNEAEFGYTFAKIPDHFKGLKLDMEGLQRQTNEATASARKTARDLGLVPEAVMKARTEVEKVGRSGAVGDSMWRAALGLSMADSSMPSDVSVKFLNAMFSSYEKQRKALADRMGMDLGDEKQREWFDRQWLRGTAAKSAFAAAKSALDPRDLVEGARQYAPQWASLGMSPEEVLGALAHGSNYGFMAPELGTAFKSWANRLVKPTPAGVGWMNTLSMDRKKWTQGFGAAAPAKATTALNGMLAGQAYAGKGGKEFKAKVRMMLEDAAREGTTATPEFQAKLTNMVLKRLGRAWAGRGDDVADAVANSTLNASGEINIMEFIREGLAKGMSRAAMLEILEGRHIARNTPMFDFFDSLVDMVEGLKKIDGTHLDAIEASRKNSRAGKLEALKGSWEELLLTLQDTGVNDTIVQGLKDFVQTIGSLNPEFVKLGTQFALVAALAAPVVFAFRAIAGAFGVLIAGAKIAAKVAKAVTGGAAAATGGAGLAATFGAGAGGAVAATKGGRMVAAGMSAAGKVGENSRVGQKMVAGMSGAGGAVAAGGAKAGGKALGKGALRFIPGIGLVIAGGMAAYDAYQGYQENGWKGALLNAVTFGMYSGKAQAAEAPIAAGSALTSVPSVPRPGPTIAAAGNMVATGTSPQATAAQADISSVQNAAQQIPGIVGSAMSQARSIIASTNLFAEGQQLIESLAAGMRAGIPAIQAAASSASAAAAGSALRGAYSDGAR